MRMEINADSQPFGAKLRDVIAPVAETHFLIENGVKGYKIDGVRQTVIDRLSIPYELGTCLALMGPNACGKSTLVRAIVGVDQLDSGRIGLSLNSRDKLGVMFQNFLKEPDEQLLSDASVRQNLLIPVDGGRDEGFDPAQILESCTEVFDRLGYTIGLDRQVKTLSGGQKQVVVLARSMAYGSNVLIWDEPTSAIDPRKKRSLYKLMAERRKRAPVSFVLVTHDLDEAIILGDRIIHFDSAMRVLCDVAVQHPDRWAEPEFLETDEAIQIRRTVRAAMLG